MPESPLPGPVEGEFADVSGGRPVVLSNLKSLLETGSPLPQDPWAMPGH
ncbi:MULTISPECIES: hypothetical protein [Streptomyces]|jgi:hypothetical protein|nr:MULTISPECIES: hypothetical protein [Streptomyces]PTM93195.1 hypothetical protein C7821_108323 [Streptomyces sp. VMFN-G11Ma]